MPTETASTAIYLLKPRFLEPGRQVLWTTIRILGP
jgi:hypothetical protein